MGKKKRRKPTPMAPSPTAFDPLPVPKRDPLAWQETPITPSPYAQTPFGGIAVGDLVGAATKALESYNFLTGRGRIPGSETIMQAAIEGARPSPSTGEGMMPPGADPLMQQPAPTTAPIAPLRSRADVEREALARWNAGIEANRGNPFIEGMVEGELPPPTSMQQAQQRQMDLYPTMARAGPGQPTAQPYQDESGAWQYPTEAAVARMPYPEQGGVRYPYSQGTYTPGAQAIPAGRGFVPGPDISAPAGSALAQQGQAALAREAAMKAKWAAAPKMGQTPTTGQQLSGFLTSARGPGGAAFQTQPGQLTGAEDVPPGFRPDLNQPGITVDEVRQGQMTMPELAQFKKQFPEQSLPYHGETPWAADTQQALAQQQANLTPEQLTNRAARAKDLQDRENMVRALAMRRGLARQGLTMGEALRGREMPAAVRRIQEAAEAKQQPSMADVEIANPALAQQMRQEQLEAEKSRQMAMAGAMVGLGRGDVPLTPQIIGAVGQQFPPPMMGGGQGGVPPTQPNNIWTVPETIGGSAQQPPPRGSGGGGGRSPQLPPPRRSGIQGLSTLRIAKMIYPGQLEKQKEFDTKSEEEQVQIIEDNLGREAAIQYKEYREAEEAGPSPRQREEWWLNTPETNIAWTPMMSAIGRGLHRWWTGESVPEETEESLRRQLRQKPKRTKAKS